jgi:peptidoglycan/xylan/chitin deacetylase (PgdA/CDA1 family)
MLAQLKTIATPLIKRAVITTGLEATPLLAPMLAGARGRGAIFTLHHVRPRPEAEFQPNDILDITPEFLETAILTLKAEGYRFVPLEEIRVRLANDNRERLAAFTLDDGCRDNATFAAPVFTRHGVPFTMFIASGFAEATHSMWWETLAVLLNKVAQLEFDFGAGKEMLAAATSQQKAAAFARLSDFINSSDETAAVAQLDHVAHLAGIDPLALTRDLTLRAGELAELAQNPLVAFGAHTISHRGLARLAADDVEHEIAGSMAYVETITGRRPRSFAYPYGDGRSVSERERKIIRSLGIEMAVTTRPGTLGPAHGEDGTAVPRISLNGHYQKARYIRALASGVPFKLMG